MIDKKYLRECVRFFAGPAYEPEKRDRFVEETRKKDSSIVMPLLAELFSDRDEEVAINSMTAALIIDRELGLEFMLPYLNNPGWPVRYHICGLMNKFGDQRAIDPLLQILKGDSDPQVRDAAAFGLRGISDVRAINDLVHTSKYDHEIDRLGYTPSQGARQAIHHILLGEVIAHVTSNPNIKIAQSYPIGSTLTGKITHLPGPIDWDIIRQNWPRDTFEYTSTLCVQAESLHPFPFLVEVTYRFKEIQARRKFVFTFGDERWAIGIYLVPENNDG